MSYTEISLHSDDIFSQNLTRANTPGLFKNFFDHELFFENSEIAIKKIRFVNYFYNINRSNNMIYYAKSPISKMSDEDRLIAFDTLDIHKFEMSEGRCSNRWEFMECFNDSADKTTPWQTFKASTSETLFSTQRMSQNRMLYTIPDDIHLYMHNDLLKMLGYDNLISSEFDKYRHPDIPKTHYLLPDMSLHNGMNSRGENYFRLDPILKVSSDLVRNTHISGHRLTNSMLEFATAGLSGESVEYSPVHLSFFPLARQSFNSATVYITTNEDIIAPFVFGPTQIDFIVRDRETTHYQL